MAEFFQCNRTLTSMATNIDGPQIEDGYYWNIKIISNAKSIVTSGHDSFPVQFNTFSTALKKLLNIGSPERWPWDSTYKRKRVSNPTAHPPAGL